MFKENISQEFRLENIDESRNYFVEEIEQNALMSKKDTHFCTNLILLNTFTFILSSTITGCI